MSSENPKRDLYAQFAAVAKAVANEHRLELLELVAQGERSVEALAERSGLSMANASQHLQHLRRAGLVTARRQAKFVLYRLADDAVLTMLAGMHKVAERNLGEVERILRSYFHARDDLEPVSRTELAKRMKQGLVTVLDVRPEDEFALGHLPGARNVPAEPAQEAPARSSTATPRSSPTAAAPIACCRSRPWRSSGSWASRRAGSRMGFPNGKRRGYPSRPGEGSERRTAYDH